MTARLARLADFAYRRRKRMVLIWVIVTWDEPAEKPAPERHRHV